MRKILFALFLAVVSVQSAVCAEYKIDPAHSSISFKIRHLAVSNVTGHFGEFSGTFAYDSGNPSASKAEAVIKAASINTSQPARDDHLRSADFLNTEKFPEIKFVSREIRNISGHSFKAAGDLTIHGVTRPVVLDAEYGGSVKDMNGKERAAFAAATEINRKDFGLTWSKLLETGQLVVGDEVRITLEIEGVKQ